MKFKLDSIRFFIGTRFLNSKFVVLVLSCSLYSALYPAIPGHTEAAFAETAPNQHETVMQNAQAQLEQINYQIILLKYEISTNLQQLMSLLCLGQGEVFTAEAEVLHHQQLLIDRMMALLESRANLLTPEFQKYLEYYTDYAHLPTTWYSDQILAGVHSWCLVTPQGKPAPSWVLLSGPELLANQTPGGVVVNNPGPTPPPTVAPTPPPAPDSTPSLTVEDHHNQWDSFSDYPFYTLHLVEDNIIGLKYEIDLAARELSQLLCLNTSHVFEIEIHNLMRVKFLIAQIDASRADRDELLTPELKKLLLTVEFAGIVPLSYQPPQIQTFPWCQH